MPDAAMTDPKSNKPALSSAKIPGTIPAQRERHSRGFETMRTGSDLTEPGEYLGGREREGIEEGLLR